MKGERNIVTCLQQLLDTNPDLRSLAEQSLAQAAQANPHLCTNPVRSLDDWYGYMERFLYHMPWQTMDVGEEASFFRRIDQNIGYFYYLIDQPLDVLKDCGYWYPSLQYEPRIAQWLTEYNKAWGEWLSGPESWSDEYYQLAHADVRFELNTDRYESPDNWHSWNEFFARRLRQELKTKIRNHHSRFVSPCDGVITDFPIKTISANSPVALMGESPYAEQFADGKSFHIVLDVNDYHRFHAPCAGQVADCRIIPGIHAGGGVIIWDDAEGRYRYDQLGETGFQSLETRGILVLETSDFGYVALIAVGIQQVSSVVWNERVQVGATLSQGEELGSFLFGGSDIILLFQPDKEPLIELDKTVKSGDVL